MRFSGAGKGRQVSARLENPGNCPGFSIRSGKYVQNDSKRGVSGDGVSWAGVFGGALAQIKTPGGGSERLGISVRN
jgi:hypothetical protein